MKRKVKRADLINAYVTLNDLCGARSRNTGAVHEVRRARRQLRAEYDTLMETREALQAECGGVLQPDGRMEFGDRLAEVTDRWAELIEEETEAEVQQVSESQVLAIGVPISGDMWDALEACGVVVLDGAKPRRKTGRRQPEGGAE